MLRKIQIAKHPVLLILIVLFSFSAYSFGNSSNVQKTSKPGFKSFQKEQSVPEILSFVEDNENEKEGSIPESPDSFFDFAPLADGLKVNQGSDGKSAHKSHNLWLLYANFRL